MGVASSLDRGLEDAEALVHEARYLLDVQGRVDARVARALDALGEVRRGTKSCPES